MSRIFETDLLSTIRIHYVSERTCMRSTLALVKSGHLLLPTNVNLQHWYNRCPFRWHVEPLKWWQFVWWPLKRQL